ncbi:hypothetical protein N9M41_02030 [Rhodopirellula sp.]|nr:hypothetical protein [Rhodopirellula sp.]
MADDLKTVEEQAFDVMLSETLGGLNPPDLSGVVLERFESNTPSNFSDFRIETAAKERERQSDQQFNRTKWIALIAAVAAVLLWVFVSPFSQKVEQHDVPIAQDLSSGPADIAVMGNQLDDASLPDVSPPPKEPTPRRGIPLLVQGGSASEGSDIADAAAPSKRALTPLPSIAELSAELNDSFFAYWKSVGVQPTAEMTAQETADQLKARIEITIPPDILKDPEALQKYFASDAIASQLSPLWLRQMTNGGVRRVTQSDRDALERELAECIGGKHSLDRTLLSWIEGQNPRSEAFHQAIGSVGRVSTVNHLAKLTMSVDLRCVRCHDSKIEGVGKQSEYWEFAALLTEQFLDNSNHSNDGRDGLRATFYELVDGRQKIAEPRVSVRWMGQPDRPNVTSVKEWADALSGSEALGRGVVNSLWEFVYGLPLSGRVVDPVAAPHDVILDSIQNRFANDLIESNFNVARTLSLVVASPVARRSVPSVLASAEKSLADQNAKNEALHAVNAFAATAPFAKRITMNQRVDQVARSVGTTLDSIDAPFVAQANDAVGDKSRSGKKGHSPSLNDDFPTAGDDLPVQWLRLLSKHQGRMEHLAYLAGFDSLPSEVSEVVALMNKKTEEDRNLILQRIWWMLKP